MLILHSTPIRIHSLTKTPLTETESAGISRMRLRIVVIFLQTFARFMTIRSSTLKAEYNNREERRESPVKRDMAAGCSRTHYQLMESAHKEDEGSLSVQGVTD